MPTSESHSEVGMNKTRLTAAVLAAGLLLYGCSAGGGSTFPPEMSTIYVNKDGQLYTAIVRTYDTDKDYYSQDELKEMAQSEASSFNEEHAAEYGDTQDAVMLDSCSLSDGIARVVYRYADGKALREYTKASQDEANSVDDIEVTTVSEGLVEGELTEENWKDAADGSDVSTDSIMRQSDLILVRVTGDVRLQVQNRILYYSGDVTLNDQFTADIENGEGYIIFK